MTSLQQAFLNLVRNKPGKLSAPVDSLEGTWQPLEQQYIESSLKVSAVGSPDTVRKQLREIVEATGADELILTAQIFDHAARLESIRIATDVMQSHVA